MSKPTLYLVAFLVAAYIGSTAYMYKRLSDTNSALSANVGAQVTNRANNVKAWCGGINEGRDYDRAFVKATSHGHIAYRLGDLPCGALVAKTLKSAQHH